MGMNQNAAIEAVMASEITMYFWIAETKIGFNQNLRKILGESSAKCARKLIIGHGFEGFEGENI